MIKRDRNANGQLRFKGSAKDLHNVNDWVRSFFHIALGEEKGEERYAKLADFGITRQKGCPMGD